jgi:preprotein translocase subunit SecA
MAGRGTDIVLGGNLEAELEEAGPDADRDAIRAAWKERHAQVVAAGGLHVVGTERHESRRIDNQLRGRSGRQGDPGSSRFYLSLEDNLMRIFASDRVGKMMQKLGMQKGEAIEHPWVTKAIENAQRKVEGRNFDIRKQLLEYDDVANDQRKVIYRQRRELMDSVDVSDTVTAMRDDALTRLINTYVPPESLEEQWDVEGLSVALNEHFGGDWPIRRWLDEDDSLHEETLRARIHDTLTSAYAEREKLVGSPTMRQIETAVMLQTLDTHWKDHLAAMDYLRQGIHLRGYAQKNPKQEYKREAFEMFSAMLDSIKHDVVATLAKLQVQTQPGVEAQPVAALGAAPAREREFEFKHERFEGFGQGSGSAEDAQPEDRDRAGARGAEDPQAQPFVRGDRKVGRNEPCPCGSGKKYKQCHGKAS